MIKIADQFFSYISKKLLYQGCIVGKADGRIYGLLGINSVDRSIPIKKVVGTLFTVIMLLCQACLAQDKDIELPKELQKHIVVLNLDYSNSKITFPNRISDVLTKKRIIALGEATHGTSEFQQVKSKFIKYLVSELNVKIFAIEANFSQCDDVNQYLLLGKGEPEIALANTWYWMWNTQELLELLQWLRNYNLSKPTSEQVCFFGFDMQAPENSVKFISNFLEQQSPDNYRTHFAAVKQIKLGGQLKQTTVDSLRNLLNQVKIYLQKGHFEVPVSSTKYLELVMHHLRIIEQSILFNEESKKSFRRVQAMNNARDKFMAENIDWILKYNGDSAKMVIWAHNMHISKISSSHGSMGSILKSAYGQNYYPIGLDFNKGTFNAVNMVSSKVEEFTVAASPTLSSGSAFNKLNIPAFFIDMESSGRDDSSVGSFFNKKLLQRNIGWAFSPKDEAANFSKNSLSELYDGLIFINDTHPTRLLIKQH